jgi:heavy metal translocating P-type ATPase
VAIRSRRLPRLQTLQLLVAVMGLSAGGAVRLLGAIASADLLWAATAAAALLPTAISVARDLLRRRAGVDIVAVLALGGTLSVGEYLAGAMIALMLATGRELEARASARARRELSALLARAPSVVHRVEGDTLTTQPVDIVRPGDVLIVAPGEVVPVDGQLVSDSAMFDESALTGETALVERASGDAVRSGGVNAGGAFRLRTTATAEESTYAAIVRLVRQAQESRAPLVRTADQVALWFVPLTVVLALLAGILARDPVRAVAVLVVATPCPLILAAPIALVGGMSRAARRGIVVKGGAALETLGRADVLLFDKTGTLTEGRARLADIETDGSIGAEEVLRLGASLDQVSTHALARPIVQAARAQGFELTLPDDVHEDAGKGVHGIVSGRQVMIGRASYVAVDGAVPAWAGRVRRRTAYEGLANVFVGVDGKLVGAMVLEDPLRPDSGRAIARLRQAGMRRVVMVTGAIRTSPNQSQRQSGLTPCTPSAPRRKRSRWCATSDSRASLSWLATASTTHRRWRPPTSGSPWGFAVQPHRPKRRTSCSWSIESTDLPKRCRLPVDPTTSQWRASPSAWGSHSSRCASRRSAASYPWWAPWCRKPSMLPSSSMRFALAVARRSHDLPKSR